MNSTVSTSLKYCYKKALNKKLQLMGGAMKYFPRNYWAMKYLGLWSSGLRIFFFEKFVELSKDTKPFNHIKSRNKNLNILPTK